MSDRQNVALLDRAHPVVYLVGALMGLVVVVLNRHGFWFVWGLVELAFGTFCFAAGGEKRWGGDDAHASE